MSHFSARTALWVFLLGLCLPAIGRAQTASVSGTVTDISGALTPHAKVTVQSLATNSLRAIETDQSGIYRITSLNPGLYDVRIEKAGFKTVFYSKITLTVDEILTLDAKLEPSAVVEEIRVEGESVAPIDLNDAQIGNVVSTMQISDLPLILRNAYQLILLSPGISQSDSLFAGFSVNGSRERNNNFLLDGTDNNDADIPGFPSGLTPLNPDATQEFRVLTSDYLPEFGRNTGAVVDIISRRGTNQLHGDAYWFGRYTALSAKDYFAPSRDARPFVRNQFGYSLGGPIFRDKTFWFVNEEFQRFRTTLTNVSVVPTQAFKNGAFTITKDANGHPLLDQNGNPTSVKVDVSSPSSSDNAFGLPLDPAIQQILAIYPPPNGPSVDDIRGLYFFPSKSAVTSDTITGRVDHYFTTTEILSVRYSFNRYRDSNLHTDFLPGLATTETNQRKQNLSLQLTSILKQTLTNDLRFGANRIRFPLTCGGLNVLNSVGPVDQFGRGLDYPLPGIAAFGCEFLGDTNGQQRFSGTYTAGDVLTWVHGRHTVKTGFDFHDIYSNSINDFVSRGLLDFNVFSNSGGLLVATNTGNPAIDQNPLLQNMIWSLFGAVDNQTQAQFFDKAGSRASDDRRGFRQREISAFVQDSYKVLSNLTVSYGLRYEFNGVPFEVNDLMSTLFANPSGPPPFTFSIVGDDHHLPSLYKNDWKDFEPRIGVAWDPFKRGRTSVRAGYGIFHDRIFGQLVSVARGVPPFQQIVPSIFVPFALVSGLQFPPTQPFSPVVPDGAHIFFPFLIDPNLRLPYNQNWNLGVQHELPRSVLVEINYVGAKGTRLLRIVDGNPPQPQLVAQLLQLGVPPEALQFINLWLAQGLPFPAVNNTAFIQPQVITGRASSSYNGFQANVTKHLTRGFFVQGAYTWSHSIDDASDPLVPTSGNNVFPRNSLNLKNERGNSDLDVTHRLVVNYTWKVPLGRGHAHLAEGKVGRIFEGWQLSGINTFAGGLPYDIFTQRDSEHTGQNSRPDFNPAATPVPVASPRTQTGPNLGLFSDPAFGLPGNVGRNRFRGPGINNWDMVLEKTVSFRERFGVDFRTEAYNVFNRVWFFQPGNLTANPGTFGQSTNEVFRPDFTTSARQIQFGVKLHF